MIVAFDLKQIWHGNTWGGNVSWGQPCPHPKGRGPCTIYFFGVPPTYAYTR